MKRIGVQLLLFVVIATTIGCDRVTKHAAKTMLMGSPSQSYLGDTVRLEYAENPGAFLSMGAALPSWLRTILFQLGPIVILCGLVVLAIRQRWSGMPLIGLGFLIAGGGSNLIDRLIQGNVIDFMNVGIGPVRTGIFNVADVAVMLGVLLIIVSPRRALEGS